MLPKFLHDADPSIYYSPNYVVVDFEVDTSHGDYGHPVHPDNKLLLAAWKHGASDEIHSHWGGEFDQEMLLKSIEDADFVVAHNAKYELGWLRRAGLDLHNVLVFDTKIGEYVLLGNLAAGDEMMAPRSTSLDIACRRRGLLPKDPVIDILMKQGINPVNMPRPWLEGRCRRDVSETEKVFLDQREHLQATNRLPVLLTRCLLTPVLADIEFEGMFLDVDEVEKEYVEHVARADKLQADMDSLTGGINWRSPKQTAEFIYDTLGFTELKNRDGSPKRTASGGRKTDKNTLDALNATTKKQKQFVELRKDLGKVAFALSKNLDFFHGVCKEYGCVFSAVFNQTSTATHRLSSSGIPTYFKIFEAYRQVQFQNLPRDFKRLFAARRKGWLMSETDGSQLEFRVGVHLSRDAQGRQDVITGHDVHRFTAAVLNGIPEADVTKGQRQEAKPSTFKPFYGGSSGTPAEQRYYAAFRERYPDLADTQKGWVYEVLDSKRLITEWGMRYYWPFAKMSKSGYVNVTSAVYNYPIQAFATAEIIPIALVYFWHRVREEGLDNEVRIVNTVHDSVIAELHPNAVEKYRRLAIQSFTKDVYRYLEKVYGVVFDFVPLGVGITIGSHWSVGNEETYNAYYDGKLELVEKDDDGKPVMTEIPFEWRE